MIAVLLMANSVFFFPWLHGKFEVSAALGQECLQLCIVLVLFQFLC